MMGFGLAWWWIWILGCADFLTRVDHVPWLAALGYCIRTA